MPFIREVNELNLHTQTESWNKLSPKLRNAPTVNRFQQATKKQGITPLPPNIMLGVEF